MTGFMNFAANHPWIIMHFDFMTPTGLNIILINKKNIPFNFYIEKSTFSGLDFLIKIIFTTPEIFIKCCINVCKCISFVLLSTAWSINIWKPSEGKSWSRWRYLHWGKQWCSQGLINFPKCNWFHLSTAWEYTEVHQMQPALWFSTSKSTV